ncbi:MAG: DNA topoisomerase [Lachnospiraceae bacterium]|nr:DNA topoisomerase [Lachnospiraceae bacterium]
MAKSLYIAEKPSVAQEFAKALSPSFRRYNGYLESEEAVVTWCVGHLVTMSYPEAYDPGLKRWSLDTLPFLPDTFKYEVIPSSAKQFGVVKKLLNRSDVETIYVCTDSGREGEYIYRLVEQMAEVHGKRRRRVWIDSQTEEEIRKGIREAKNLSAYDNLAASAYLRAKEDYLMGINFSRLLTLKYGRTLAGLLHRDRVVLSVGRVMTCVLGMTVRREREIRAFVKTPFYRVLARTELEGQDFEAEWKAVEGSRYWQHPALYRENGFRERADAEKLIAALQEEGTPPSASQDPWEAQVVRRERKTEKKNPPLLFNLAELQNVCAKTMKLSPDETLKTVQELYEKKLVTYPRTDARVLSTAIAKDIGKNIRGLTAIPGVRGFAQEILDGGLHKNIAKTRYTNDKQITDHYAIIPTGQGIGGLSRLSERHVRVYEKIVRRFLSIFYPPAVYERTTLEILRNGEHFFATFKILTDRGFMKVTGEWKSGRGEKEEAWKSDPAFREALGRLRKGSKLTVREFLIKEGETSPPKRYTSGSMILAMENAGQLIEDEELRAQIRGSGIGTSATRAEILKKLVTIQYLNLNKKTQVITPTLLGELVFDTVNGSIRSLLNPELTASWEKGLTQVAEGSLREEEYMEKLQGYIRRRTEAVLTRDNSGALRQSCEAISGYYH